MISTEDAERIAADAEALVAHAEKSVTPETGQARRKLLRALARGEVSREQALREFDAMCGGHTHGAPRD
jgi:hypothetical protein